MYGRILGAVALSLMTGAPAMADHGEAHLGNVEMGEEVFDYCSGCHQVGKGAENGIGPHLNGVFGRRAGSVDGFSYSGGLVREGKNGLTWEVDKLEAYLTNPQALVSDTRMSFDGLETQEEINDVLAFLRQFSDDPQNIPEASPTARAPEVELPPEVLAIVGDPDYGEYLAAECTTCHQIDGDYDGIPAIVAWPEDVFVVAMHAYKTKVRPHPVMQMMTGRLTDEEIAALAAYFGKLE